MCAGRNATNNYMDREKGNMRGRKKRSDIKRHYQPEYSKSACLGSCSAGRTAGSQFRALRMSAALTGLLVTVLGGVYEHGIIKDWADGSPFADFGGCTKRGD